MIRSGGERRRFLVAALAASVWVNASEVFRYFVVVMPAVRRHLAAVPDVAPMSGSVFAVWAVWDAILTVFVAACAWLLADRVGGRIRGAVAAGTFAWVGFFVLFWLAMWNMGLSSPTLPLVALPLAWLEMIVAAWIALQFHPRMSERGPTGVSREVRR